MDVLSPNGTTGVDPLDAQIEQLEALLAPLLAERDQLEVALAAIASRERRVKGAISALREPPPNPNPRKPASQKSSKNDWKPSAESVERVFNGLVGASPETTVTSLAEALGMGRDTVARAMDILRDDERVRVSGTTRGGGRTYAVMP